MAATADVGFVPDAPSADVGFVPDDPKAASFFPRLPAAKIESEPDLGFVPDTIVNPIAGVRYPGASTIAGGTRGKGLGPGGDIAAEYRNEPSPNLTKTVAQAVFPERESDESLVGFNADSVPQGQSAAGRVGRSLEKTGIGFGQWLTSPEGVVQTVTSLTPARLLVMAQWAHDMAAGAGESAGRLSTLLPKPDKTPEDLQQISDDTVGTIVNLVAAGKIKSDIASEVTGVRSPLGRMIESRPARLAKDLAVKLDQALHDFSKIPPSGALPRQPVDQTDDTGSQLAQGQPAPGPSAPVDPVQAAINKLVTPPPVDAGEVAVADIKPHADEEAARRASVDQARDAKLDDLAAKVDALHAALVPKPAVPEEEPTVAAAPNPAEPPLPTPTVPKIQAGAEPAVPAAPASSPAAGGMAGELRSLLEKQAGRPLSDPESARLKELQDISTKNNSRKAFEAFQPRSEMSISPASNEVGKVDNRPEKTTTAGTETDADNSQQSESNLPNGRSGITVPEPAAGVKPKRVARGTTGAKVFDRETELGGPDILSWMRDNMTVTSKSMAKSSHSADWWNLNKSLYDDAPILRRPHHNLIYGRGRGGAGMPDQVAAEAHKAGLLKSGDVSELWSAIKQASERRRGVFEQQKANEKLLMDQAEWHKATAKGDLRVRAEELKPGDHFEVDGERFTVKRVDPSTGDVELQDGKKFGRQTLQRGMSIWIEKPDEAISDRVAENAGAEDEGAGPVEFTPDEKQPAQQFKVGDKVLHEGQIKTVTKAVPGSDYVGVGKRAVHVKELKLASLKDKAEVVAKKLDKLKSGIKGGRGGQMHAFGIAADLWDRAVSVAQGIIRAGGSIADAINAAIKHIRENHQGEFDEQGARAKLNESVRDEALERSETGAEQSVPPDRERSMVAVKTDLADSQVKLKELARATTDREAGTKKERLQAMYMETARYRNLREELLHHPDYIAEQLAKQHAAITEANEILKPVGLAMRLEQEPPINAMKDKLTAPQFDRVRELSDQITEAHGELMRMPKKMVSRIYGEMQKDGRLPKSAASNPDIGRSLDNLTNWLRENGVDSPRKTLAERLNLGARAAEMIHSSKTSAQKALLTAQGLWKAAVESYKSPPKDDDFRHVIKSWIYADQRTSRADQDFVNEVVKEVPNVDRRKAIAIWLDADGDPDVLKFQADSVPPIYRKPWELAMKLTNSEKQLAMKIRQDFADKLEAGQNAGLIDQGRADYGVPQRWKISPETEVDPAAELQKGSPGNPFAKLDSRSPFFAFRRATPSYFDGIMAKGVPENLDIAHLVSTYDRAFHKTLSSRGMIAALQDAKAKDGLPVVRLSGSANVVSKDGGKTFFVDSNARSHSDASADGRPYRSLDHSSLKGWKLVRKDDAGNPIIVKGDMMIHPDHFEYLENELGQSALREGRTGQVLGPIFQSQAFLKASKLSGSAFHLMTIGEHMASHLVNPFTGGFKIDLRVPDQQLLVRNGLIASLDHARMAYEEGLMSGHGGLFNKIPGLGDLSAKLTDWMFNEYIPTIMMKTGLKMLKSNRERYSKATWEGKALTDDQIAELTANQMNAAGGLLNKRIAGADGNVFGKIGANKTMMDLQRMALMAPQFLEARMRVVGQALKPYGHQQRKLLIVQAAVLYAGCRVLNELLDGDPHWNDNPFSVVHNGRAYSIRTIVGDFYHLLSDPASFAAGRLAPLMKIAVEDGMMGGRDLRTGNRKDVLIETHNPIGRMAQNVVQDLANWLTPIPVEGLLPGSSGKDQTVGGMVLSSVGVGSHKFTASSQMYQMASDFNRNSTDAKANKYQADRDNRSFGHSDYAKLDALLDAGKLEAAKSEYKALLGEGKTPGMIAARYSRDVRFTGNADREEQFVASLTPKQMEIYQKAKAEQAKRGEALQTMLNSAQ